MEKRRLNAAKTEVKQKRATTNTKKMLEENAKVMKDAKANKTYLCASFMTGDEEAPDDKQQPAKKGKTPHCNLPNCTNPKGHMWNSAKQCRWYGQFTHINTQIKEGKKEIKSVIIAYLQQKGETVQPPPIMFCKFLLLIYIVPAFST